MAKVRRRRISSSRLMRDGKGNNDYPTGRLPSPLAPLTFYMGEGKDSHIFPKKCSEEPVLLGYFTDMSLTEIMAELPALTVAEREFLVRRVLDLDEPTMSIADEAEVERRLADYRRDPDSSVSLEEMKARLRKPFAR